MVVANLPAVQSKSSKRADILAQAKEVVADLLADGHAPTAIARQLAKGDPKKAKAWRKRIRNWMYGDEAFQQQVALKLKGEQMLSLGQANRALIKRANRGRVDAIKLLFESTGFHNPRVQHEHSGEVKIEITNMPRPVGEVGGAVEEPVVDAEVVEE